MSKFNQILVKFWEEYKKETPKKLKVIDAYLVYVFLTGVIQFVYCCLVGTFPFNSFLAGFISCVSCFVLGGKVKAWVEVNRFSLPRPNRIFTFYNFSVSSSSIKLQQQDRLFRNITRTRIC